jgi:hypothetical protein
VVLNDVSNRRFSFEIFVLCTKRYITSRLTNSETKVPSGGIFASWSQSAAEDGDCPGAGQLTSRLTPG